MTDKNVNPSKRRDARKSALASHDKPTKNRPKFAGGLTPEKLQLLDELHHLSIASIEAARVAASELARVRRHLKLSHFVPASVARELADLQKVLTAHLPF